MGRVNVYGLSFKFSSRSELTRILNMIYEAARGSPEITVEFDRPRELLWVRDVERFRPVALTLRIVRPEERAPPKRDVQLTDADVYKALKELIAEKLQRGEQAFTLVELYEKLFGRAEPGALESPAVRRARALLRRVVDRVSRELGVELVGEYVHKLSDKRGRYRVYRIVKRE